MAGIVGWFTRLGQTVARVATGVVRGVTRVFRRVTGQRPSTAVSPPPSDQGVVSTPDQVVKDVISQGVAQTSTGQVVIDTEREQQTVVGKIPQEWRDAIDLKEPKIVGRPSIFGEPFQYQVEFKVLERHERPDQSIYYTTFTEYYTITSESELTPEQIVARGLELGEVQNQQWGSAFGGTVIGVGEIQPVYYTS